MELKDKLFWLKTILKSMHNFEIKCIFHELLEASLSRHIAGGIMNGLCKQQNHELPIS